MALSATEICADGGDGGDAVPATCPQAASVAGSGRHPYRRREGGDVTPVRGAGGQGDSHRELR